VSVTTLKSRGRIASVLPQDKKWFGPVLPRVQMLQCHVVFYNIISNIVVTATTCYHNNNIYRRLCADVRLRFAQHETVRARSLRKPGASKLDDSTVYTTGRRNTTLYKLYDW
jgi:hypothetical protein